MAVICLHTDDLLLDSLASRYIDMNEAEGTTLSADAAATLSFCGKFAVSPQFKALFDQGMSLVERTANYLDGPGRAEARLLKPPASLMYSTESMRLTTRLMQMASWLLLRRAVTQGQLTDEMARTHKRRVQLAPQSRQQGDGFEDLPPSLLALIEESHRLYERILRLDKLLKEPRSAPAADTSPVEGQVARLRIAFSAA
jgi:regulator of CtrA degradation